MLPRWLSPPSFQDPERDHLARILHYYLGGGLLISFAAAPILFALRGEIIDVIACLSAIANNVVLLALLRRGIVRPVGYLALAASWGLVTLFSVLQQGLLSTPLYGYFALIPFAGVLIGWRTGAAVTLLCIASGFGVAAAQEVGSIAGDQVDFDAFFHWTAATLFLLVAFVVQYVIATTVLRISEAQKEEALRRLQAEEERRRAEQQLLQNERLRAIGGLAGGIAHDFNNVLATITARADLLAFGGRLDEEAMESVRGIQAGAAQGAALVRQIFTISKKDPPAAEPIDMAGAVRESLALLRPLAPEQVPVIEEIAGDCPAVRIERSHVHQMITNLVVNAFQAQKRQSRGSVAVALRRVGGQPDRVSLAIADEGPGIPQEHLPRVFDPFFTTKGPEQGTGLGLSIVKGLAERYGGSIRVDPGEGRGCRFEIVLPADGSPRAFP